MIPRLRHPDDMDLARLRESPEYQSRRVVNIAELRQAVVSDDGYGWLLPYNWDVVFEFYRWAVWNAWKLGPTAGTRWGTESASADIADFRSCVNVTEPRAFVGGTRPRPMDSPWRADMLRRLRFLLFSDAPLVSEWRRRAKLDPPGKMVVRGPFANTGMAIEYALRVLFWCAHPLKRLTVAPNEQHPGARQPARVELHPMESGWRAVFQYDYEGDGGWDLRCDQRKGEAFVAFALRATSLFDGITAPCAQPAVSGPLCSGKPDWPVETAGCGYQTAPPVEEDFALVGKAGKVTIVRAPNAREAWRKGTTRIFSRCGNAWEWRRGRMTRDYQRDSLEYAADLFVAFGKGAAS